MNTAPRETDPAGTPSTGTGYASTTTEATSRARRPAKEPSDGVEVARLKVAAPSTAMPAAVTGTTTGKSRRVSDPSGCAWPAALGTERAAMLLTG
jgi:hypothetical protein